MNGCFPENRQSDAVFGEWDPALRLQLDEFIAACAEDPLRLQAWAVFDWDWTLFFGDIGDALFSYMLEKRLFFRPHAWAETSDHFTDAALRALEALLPGEGERIPASDELRAQMAQIYFNHATTAGEPAFAGYDAKSCHPSYAWFGRLLAGFSVPELQSLTREVLKDLLESSPKTEKYNHPEKWWARPVLAMMDLLKRLHAVGISIAVVSASPQVVVEACVAFFGLPVAHVVGVRTRLDDKGHLTSEIKPCGSRCGVIPYGRGKRAWISRVIGGRENPAWDEPDAELSGRIWFAAGDSDGDWAMLSDASRLRLVSSCRENRAVSMARENADGRWLLNIFRFEA